MQPFTEQPLGQLGVTAACPDEVGERAEDSPPPRVQASLEQRLRAGRETDVFAIKLGQRVTTCLELRQRGLRLPAGGPGTHLLLLQRRDVPARVLQCFDRPNGGMRVPRDLLRGCFSLPCRFMCGGFAVLPLCGRQCQLLAQLTPLAIERGSLELEG